MKRFYKDVTIVAEGDGHAIRLDDRPVRTPARALLTLPTLALAQAVAEEWRAQEETVDPASMPFTGLANAAIDHIVPNRAQFAAGIARYGESDLLCYRAHSPETLVRLHAAVAMHDPFRLAGLSTLVTLSGSLVCGLAVVENSHSAEAIWPIAEIDEAWQVEQWGEDAQAAARSARRKSEFSMAGAFCAMS